MMQKILTPDRLAYLKNNFNHLHNYKNTGQGPDGLTRNQISTTQEVVSKVMVGQIYDF